jgi:gamma-glutamyl phosphate reductase
MVSPFSEHRHILFREDGGIRSRVDTAWSTGGRGKNFAIKNEQLRRTLLNRLREEKDLAVQGALVWSLTYSQREDAQITELFFKKIEATENVELRRLLVDSLALGASGMDICENLLSYLKAFKDPIGRWEIIRHLASVEVRTELSTQQKEKVVEALMTVLETDSEESLREAAALGLKNFFPSRQSIPANVVSELAGIANLEKSEKVIARINELLQIEPKR